MLVFELTQISRPHKTVDHEPDGPRHVGRQTQVARLHPKALTMPGRGLDLWGLVAMACQAVRRAHHGGVLLQAQHRAGTVGHLDRRQLWHFSQKTLTNGQLEQLAHHHQVLRHGGRAQMGIGQALDKRVHHHGRDLRWRDVFEIRQHVGVEPIFQNADRCRAQLSALHALVF